MKKSDLLRALQTEIQKHNLSSFTDAQDKVVITGCSFCRRHFGTVEQFKRHISEDWGTQIHFTHSRVRDTWRALVSVESTF